MATGTTGGERRRLRVRGTVQGVGFRPFVYRHAVALGLTGFVLNDSAGVLVEAEGSPGALAELQRRMLESPPPLARVESVEAAMVAEVGPAGAFRILDSADEGAPAVPVSVDTATCSDCLAEVDDPADRRYGYPFTNCTNCGPRYTIVESVPYDRPATTMGAFSMCPACQAEYDDPGDRRFHAQPNACPDCGPQLRFVQPDGRAVEARSAALERAVQDLRAGRILAVKGLGGYHLAADATNARAVAELRRRKARDDKPFAVMVRGTDQARAVCHLDAVAEAALVSQRRPIVLARRRPGGPVADGVAPDLPELGLMLAYTALHHLLVARVGSALVMTSGNSSDEPIAYTDEDAITRLGPLVDGLLAHNRAIHVRCDDSVMRASGSGLQLLRRSRGYAPEPLALPAPARRQVLALGAELKSTVSVAKSSYLVASHHLGDLEHLSTYQSFLQAIDHLCHLYGVSPDVVAHDLHPEYLSTKTAVELDLEPWAVQHHHAHVASCLVEHGRTAPVLGVAFDGLGLGPDSTLWGGEFLVADLTGFRRVGHLRPVHQTGGVAAVKEPWRMGLVWAHASVGAAAAARLGAALDARWAPVLELVKSGTGPVTTSAGRLFDAVAALMRVRSRVTYEGQAAIELEALARRVPLAQAPPYPAEVAEAGGAVVLDPVPLVGAVLGDLEQGTSREVVSAGFHRGFGKATATVAARLARANGLDTVALSGGVFQNAVLTAVVQKSLRAEGLATLVHHSVPPNDGGISLGQAAIAALSEHPPT